MNGTINVLLSQVWVSGDPESLLLVFITRNNKGTKARNIPSFELH